MDIYLDRDFRCHTRPDGDMQKVTTDFFDGQSDLVISGYRYVPSGQSWEREDGRIFHGEMVSPVDNYGTLEAYKRQYDATQPYVSALVYEGAALAQASTEEPSPTVGVLADGFQAWKAGMYYEKLYSLFTYDGKVGFTRQPGLTSQAHYPPFSTGTEAQYGVRPVPDDVGIYPYVRNMATSNGMRVRSAKDGAVYVAIQAADPLLYDPADVPALFAKEDDL